MLASDNEQQTWQCYGDKIQTQSKGWGQESSPWSSQLFGNIKASSWGGISVSHTTSLMLEMNPVFFCLFFLPPSLSFAPSSQFTRVERYSFPVYSGKNFRNVAENKIVQIRRFESRKIATILSDDRADYVRICSSHREVAYSRYVECKTAKAGPPCKIRTKTIPYKIIP